MTVSSQSRIKILDRPILAPGSCCLCGSAGGDGRKFIDFGKQLDWYGAVYFCSECIREASEACGFIPVASFEKLHDEYRRLQIRFDQMAIELKSVKDALSTILNNRSSGSTNTIDNNVTSLSLVEKSESPVETNRGSETRDSETNESSNVEGPDDFFDSTDFD